MGKLLISLALVLGLSTQTMAGNIRTIPFKTIAKSDVDKSELSKEDRDYFAIKEITVEDKGMILDPNQNMSEDKTGAAGLGSIIMSIEKLLALGTKIWKIIEAGKPNANVAFATPISIIPKTKNGADAAFYDMEHWSAPYAQVFQVTFKNYLGMSVIKFDYMISFQHGGQYQGKGKYLTGLAVSARNVSVMWGFDLIAKSELINISNRGSSADPVAAATFRIDYTADGIFNNLNASEVYHVTGEGHAAPIYR